MTAGTIGVILDAVGAAFLACALAGGLFCAARTIIRPLRKAHQSPAPGYPPHGGLVKRIDVYADMRTEVTDYRRPGQDRVVPGNCEQCRPFPAWDPDAELRDLLP